MELELRSKGIEMTAGLRAFTEKKLHFALGRFSHRVQRVRVTWTDINGPKGGEDIRCHVQVSLGRTGAASITETRGDAFAAVSRAFKRTSQHLSRRLARPHTSRRAG